MTVMSFVHFMEAAVELDEVGLTIQGRRKLARSMKRRKSILKRARARAMKRMARKPVLQKRARRQGRAFAKKILARGKTNLSVAQKKSIETRLKNSGWQQRIANKTRRLMPKVRKAEISRKR